MADILQQKEGECVSCHWGWQVCGGGGQRTQCRNDREGQLRELRTSLLSYTQPPHAPEKQLLGGSPDFRKRLCAENPGV